MRDGRLAYGSCQLTDLRASAGQPDDVTLQRVHALRLWRGRRRARGCRAGKHKQDAALRSADCGQSAIASSSPVNSRPPVNTSVVHSTAAFGCLNIRSLLNKFDDVVELIRDHQLDVLCLTESWCDADSSVLGRLRCAGYNVVDRPRERDAGAGDQSVNHGGLVVVSTARASLSVMNIVSPPRKFELLCTRVTAGKFTAILCAVYRPGSWSLDQEFFEELAAVFDHIATYREPVFIVGDFNVRLDRPDDPYVAQFRTLVGCYGLVLHDTTATHQRGGTLDAVITHATDGLPECVAVLDVGLSDHHMLRWEVDVAVDTPPAVTVSSRPWRRLDIEQLKSELTTSRLCQSTAWDVDIDQLAALYDDELNRLLDRLLPVCEFTRRLRPSDPWFDKECRDAKRTTRRLERAHAAACRRAAKTTTSSSAAAAATAVAKVADTKAAWYGQRRAYRRLRRQKCAEFWRTRIEADQGDSRRLWRSVDVLLGRGRLPPSATIDAESFNRFFFDKVAKVRAGTSDAPPPSYSRVCADVSFQAFSPVTCDDVITAVRRLPDKFSAADPIPTAVLKEVAELLAPYFVELFNRSFATGQFPSTFKEAFITPIVKKPGLDVNDVASYRPISNLTVVSKVLERLAAHQLMDYLKASDLLPSMQSGFRPGHSTETAVLRVLADILQAVDCGDVAALVLLDLSAAFDTVDHSILLQRLNTTFGISATAHSWFRSYLSGRSQCVRRGSIRSSITRLLCGVPQGSVLGPILFIMYVADLVCLIQDHGLSAHQYADDTQVYGACRPAAVNALSSQITGCVDTVASWMKSNRLQLNADKTEVMWCATGRRQHQLPTTPLSVNGVPVQPVKSVRDLGVHIDGDLVMRTHVQRTVSRCFAVLRQLRQIRHVVPTSTFQTLVVSLVLSRLDYGNAVLVGLPAYLLNRLQSVLNAAARLIFGLRYTDHITEALVSLHWLRAPQRIQFKVAVLAYKVLNGSAPQYLGPLVRTADLPGRRPLRSTASNRLDVPRFRLTTVGSRAFPVAASRIWNDLPADVTSSPSLSIFRRRLKTVLFKLSHNID